jgi:hypothetical protein
MVVASACTTSRSPAAPPGLAARGTTMTTVKPTRQDLTNRVSLSGKIGLNPVYGLVAPVGGQVRYRDVTQPQTTPTKPTKVAAVWSGGKSTEVSVPAGSVFAGRLVDDKSTVAAGTPIVSARFVGYGIIADIDGASAYRIIDSISSVQAQIKNGPGPFACAVLGSIAALPAGTIPEPSTPASSQPAGAAGIGNGQAGLGNNPAQGSDPTGMRLVCTPPVDVKMINGASVTLDVITAKASNALVLPVEAVAGSQGAGKVDLVKTDGTRETRDVVLGLTDGKVIEIRSGLTGDETVAVPGPNIPTAQPQVGGGSGAGPVAK